MTRAHLIASSALAAVLAVAGEAAALPQSPVISGTNGPGPGATFNTTANTLSVTQTNSRVLIDWAGFNIASGETVTFAQPSNSAIALNRVNATSFTTISGALNANGGVWVLSPAGMLIGNGANISVGTFLASTAIADSNTSSAFLNCCGEVPFSPQPATATPSITVQAGATISANAGFVELNSTTIVQNGDVSASDSVSYSALPGRTIDFDQGPNGLKLTDFGGNVAPAQNQATSITHTGTTSAGQVASFVTFNDATLGAPVNSVINLSGNVSADGIIADSTSGSAYSVLLIADDAAGQVTGGGTFQVSASSVTAINAAGSTINARARIGAEAGSIATGDWLTIGDIGGSGLNIQAGSGGLTVANTLTFNGFGEASLTSLGPLSISGLVDSSMSQGLTLTGSSISVTGAIITTHGFFNLSTAGPLTITGAVGLDSEGGSLIESGSSPVILNGGFGANGDLGPNVSLAFTGAPDSGQSLAINGQPYALIFSQAELLGINNDLTGHYALASSLDLTGTIFGGAPIAPSLTPFSGVFTGLGNTVSNLSLVDQNPAAQQVFPSYTSAGLVGLFGLVDSGGRVEDVKLANANIQATDGMDAGALVGLMGIGGTVVDASSSGHVAVGNQDAFGGGLVGLSDGIIANSSSSASVTGGTAFVGGLVGGVFSFNGVAGSISGSSASGDVSVGGFSGGLNAGAGGLVGVLQGAPSIIVSVQGSHATGSVTGGAATWVGGFVGAIAYANISDAYATGAVSQTAASGTPNQYDQIGGFVGTVSANGVVTQAYASGAVSSVGAPNFQQTTIAGGFAGLVGNSSSSVSDAYATGSVSTTGVAAVSGGFAGAVINNGSVANVYATGAVSGPFVGGVVEQVGNGVSPGGTLTNAYWDEGTTGTTTGYTVLGSGSATNVTGVGGGTGLSAYDPASYGAFDLANTWFMLSGATRPILRSEWSTSITAGHQLQLMAMNPAASYTLAGDIDLSATTSASGVWNPASGFVPVGPGETTAFTGGLDGAGHTISNLTIIDTTAVNQTVFGGFAKNGFAGLFGFIGPSGVVENLNIANTSVTVGDGMGGGILAGAMEGTAYSVSTSGSVTVGNGVNTALGFAVASGGGLTGGFDGQAIDTSSSATVTGGDAYVGGLVGLTVGNANVPAGVIYASHATGDVTDAGTTLSGDTAIAGGLVGALYGYSFGGVNPFPLSVVGSYASGNVTGGGGTLAGGFAGLVQEGSVTTSYATGSVTLTAGGQNGADSVAGGFAGDIVNNSIVDKSWSGGAVTVVGGPSSSLFTIGGGFTGGVQSNSVAEKDYSLSSLTASGSAFSLLGGVAGYADTNASFSSVYATGAVSGPSTVSGGLIGALASTATLTNSYWDEGTTGLTNAVPSNAGTVTFIAGVGGATGHSPYAESSYLGLGFNDQTNGGDWTLVAGETRPILVNEFSATITNDHQLQLMGLKVSDHYTLAADIDASETTQASGIWNPANGFVPVGGKDLGAFTGILDGQGHTISNLTIINTTPVPQNVGVTTLGLAGLFGYANGALIENVNLANVSVTAGDGMRAGALVGNLVNGSLVDDTSSGTVAGGSAALISGTTYVASAGGLAGRSTGSILDSHSSATVTSSGGYAGGLAGTFGGPELIDSYATGAVTTGSFNGVNTTAPPIAGGLVGLMNSSLGSVAVSDSYATGAVTGGGGSFVGGFAGAIQGNSNLVVTSSYATGAVTQTAGGLNGANDLAGGFAGDIGGAAVSQSYASGAVTTVGGASGLVTNAGGFVGLDEGTITDAYATGAVTSSGNSFATVGGFVGLINLGGSANRVYATGLVSGPGGLGGLAGQVGDATQTDTSGQLTNSYWDTGTTGQTTGYTLNGTGSATNATGMGGATGVDPFGQSTYAGWDFANTWETPSAGFYPELVGASHVLQITGGATSYAYGGYTTVTYRVLGLQGGDDASVLQGLVATINGATTATSGYYNAGGYAVNFGSATATGSSGPYRIAYAPGTLTVTPLALTGSLSGSVDKTYDGTTVANFATGNYQLSGAIAGDSVGLNDPATGAYAGKSVGSGIVVTSTGLALTGADAGNYTVNASANAAIGAIDPKALTASLIGAVDKTYDGTTVATIATGNYQLSGALAGDSVALNDPAAGAYADKSVGSGIVVSSTGLALTGADAGNYTVNASASAAIGTIDPKALTASLIGTVDKTYDGTTTAALTVGNYQLAGAVGGDSVALNDPTSGAYAGKGVGAGILVSSAGLALTGADAGNYTVNASASAAIGTIDPKTLTASLIGAVDKTYDGTTVATIATGNYQLSGAIAGDSVALNDPALGAYAGKDVGSGIVVSSTGLALTGADAGNYSVNLSASAAIGTIDPKALSASLVGTVDKTYDGTATAPLAAGNYQLTGGVIAGDSVGLNDPASGAYAGKSVGSGIVVSSVGLALTGADAGDYTVNGSAAASIGTIDPKALTASLIGSVDKTYDGATTATLAVGNYQLSGAIAGDNVALNDPASGSYASKNAGNGILVSSTGLALIGSDAGNYTVNASVNAAIGTIDPEVLAASLIGSVDKTYDGTTTATLAPGNYQLSGGVIAGDNVGLNGPTTGAYASKNVGAQVLVTATGLALTGADAGDYTVNGSASAAIGTIDPKALTASLIGTVDKTYDGATTAPLAAANYQLSGTIAGDSIGLNDPTSGAYAGKDVGSSLVVTANGLALTGADAGNYTVNASASASIGIIDPKALTAALIGAVDKTYDGATVATLAAGNYQLSGAVGGDNVALNDPATGSYAGKSAGTNLVVTSTGLALTGADAGDYTVNGSASAAIGTIDPKVLNAALLGTVDKTYDGTTTAALAGGNYQLGGGVIAGDSVSLNDPTTGSYAGKSVGTNLVVTSTGLALIGADAGNYTVNVSVSAAIGTIDPKALTASLIGAVDKTYDGATTATLAAGNYQLSGVVGGDSVSLNDPTSGGYASKNVGAGIVVSVFGLAISGSDAGNYTVNGSASAASGIIDPVALTASLTGIVDKTYDGATTAPLAAGNYQLSGGVIAGDSVSLNDPTTGAYASKNAGAGLLVTATGLALTGPDAGNYAVNGAAAASIGVIDPKTLTASLIGAVDKTYDGTTVATIATGNYQLSGAIAGDSVGLNDPATGAYAGKSVGSGIVVTSTGLALTGADAGNYTVNASTNAAIGAIDPKALTASLIGAVDKTYDGTATATLATGNYQLGGAIAGDSVALNDPASGSYAGKNVGSGIVVTSTGLALTGADAGNYSVNGSASAAIGTIDPKALTASLIGAVDKTYDGATTASLASGNYQLSGGVIAGDSVALNDPALGAYAGKNVGSGIVVTSTGLALTGAAAGDYTVNGSASAAIGTIDPKALGASLIGAVDKTYDGTATATLAAGNYQLSGAVAGDSVALNDPTTGSYASKSVGSGIVVSVTGLALTGTDAGNYTVNSSAAAPVGVINDGATVIQTQIVTLSPGNLLTALSPAAGFPAAGSSPTTATDAGGASGSDVAAGDAALLATLDAGVDGASQTPPGQVSTPGGGSPGQVAGSSLGLNGGSAGQGALASGSSPGQGVGSGSGTSGAGQGASGSGGGSSAQGVGSGPSSSGGSSQGALASGSSSGQSAGAGSGTSGAGQGTSDSGGGSPGQVAGSGPASSGGNSQGALASGSSGQGGGSGSGTSGGAPGQGASGSGGGSSGSGGAGPGASGGSGAQASNGSTNASGGGGTASGPTPKAQPPAVGASDTAAAAETAPAPGQGVEAGVFPVARSASSRTRTGSSSPTTGAGNGDLWKGSDLGEGATQ